PRRAYTARAIHEVWRGTLRAGWHCHRPGSGIRDPGSGNVASDGHDKCHVCARHPSIRGEGAAAHRSANPCYSKRGSDIPTLRRTLTDGATGILVRLSHHPSRPHDRVANLRWHRDVGACAGRHLTSSDELENRVLAPHEPHWDRHG